MKLGELFVELGFKADTYKVKDFAQTVGTLPLNLLAAGAALIGMDLSFMSLTSSTMEMGNSLMMFKAQTGEATDYLERWEMVGRRVNVQNNVVSQSFQGMMQAITRLRVFGQGNAGELFGRLHISGFMSKTPEQLMTELRERYRTLKTPKEIQDFWSIASGLGISQDMARVFQGQDPNKMNVLMGQVGQQAAADLTAALSRFSDEVRSDFIPVLVQLIPAMKSLAGYISDALRWITTNKWDPGRSVWNAGRGLRRWMDQVSEGEGLFSNDRLYMPGMVGPQGVPHLTVNQNFYGDVDKGDIDNGRLTLEHSLIRASRQLNRGGR